MFLKNDLFKEINKKIDKISLNMEKLKFVDYVYYLEHPRKMLLANFVGGLSRGIGMAVGFTILGALVLYFLKVVVQWNLPVIGEFISEIVTIVQNNIKQG